MKEKIFNELKALMLEEVGDDLGEITPDSAFSGDLDINSLEFMNLILAAEDHFGVELDEDRLRDVKTVGDVVSYISELNK